MTSATLGSTVTYTVAVTNSGQTNQPAASFTDSLTGVLDGANYNPAATTVTGGGTTSYSGGVLGWSGSLAVGASATVTYTVTIKNPDPGDKSMPNTVVSTTSGNNCASGSPDARCTASVTVTNSTTLTFTKVAGVTTTVPGAAVSYTVTAVNSSATAVTSANFTDSLGGVLDDATYNSDAAVTGGGSITYASPNLSWTGTVPGRRHDHADIHGHRARRGHRRPVAVRDGELDVVAGERQLPGRKHRPALWRGRAGGPARSAAGRD